MKNTNNSVIRYIDTGVPDQPGIPGAHSPLSEKELSAIERINLKIAGMKEVRDTMEFLFSETQDIFPCDRMGLAFFEEDGTRLTLRHVIAGYEPLYVPEGYTADMPGSSLEKIFHDGTPRIINDLEAYAASNPGSESTRLLLREGVMSSMTCPLLVDGRPVALLFRSSRKKGAYTKKEVTLHLLIAERLGQAVEKTYRIDELSKAISSYMEMLGFVTHELRSPLDTIVMMAKTMTSGYVGELSPEQKDYLERIIKKAEYLGTIAGDYLNLARFESGQASLRPVKAEFIGDIASEALDMILPQAREKNITMEKQFAAAEIPLECDTGQMKIVMVNLLSNAVKYGDTDGKVRLEAASDAGSLTVTVWNSGPGFSQDDKKKLFRKFSRLESSKLAGRKGSGIGLYTTWKIIHLHGGKIWADSKQGEWAEFGFSIPLIPPAPEISAE